MDKTKTDESAEIVQAVEGSLAEKIGEVAKDLYYISETDAEILPFAGNKAEAVSGEEVLRQTQSPPDAPVEERDFAEFFEQLTKLQDWFEEEETATAQRFAALRDLLEQNLRDLKVFRVGSIQLDIYVVGLDEKNMLTGIKTKAVET